MLSVREDRILARLVLSEPSIGSPTLNLFVKNDFKKNVTDRKIRNYMIRRGLSAHRNVKKQLLTQKMRQKRLQWAEEPLKKPDEFWRSILFSDESYINIFCGQSTHARRPIIHWRNSISSKYFSQAPKHPISVMIWGCFSYFGVGRIKVVSGTMKSNNYIDVLKEKMLPSANDIFKGGPYIFQDDSAPCHRSKTVREWHKINGVQTLEWPGNSSDLNPIDNLWGILKQRIRAKKLKSRSELISAIVRVWHHEIDVQLCQNLIASMKSRLQVVIKNSGGHT